MDLFALGYFAVICALLALGSPLLAGRLQRLLFGLTTGLIAVTALPFLRSLALSQLF